MSTAAGWTIHSGRPRFRPCQGVRRLPDALIADTALEHSLQPATRDAKDFERVRVLRLRVLRCSGRCVSPLGMTSGWLPLLRGQDYGVLGPRHPRQCR